MEDTSHSPPPPQRNPWVTRAWAAGHVLAVAYLWLWVWGLFWSIAPATLPGWESRLVSSGSMRPGLNEGDVVVTSPTDGRNLGPGTVISFEDPSNPGSVVTHRIVEAIDEATYRTRGDANRAIDSGEVDAEAVIGVGRVRVPWVGLPLHWVRDGAFGALGLWGLSLVAGTAVVSVSRRYEPSGDDEGPGDGTEAADAPSPAGGENTSTSVAAPAGRGGSVMYGTVQVVTLAMASMVGAVALWITAMWTGALFTASTTNLASSWTAGFFSWIAEVDSDGPIHHWRLSPSTAGPFSFSENFSSGVAGWVTLVAGDVVANTVTSRFGSPTGVAEKISNNDPSGAAFPLGAALGNDWTLEAWVQRPLSSTGGNQDRIGIENSAGDGYTFAVVNPGGTLRIDRRSGGSPTTIASSASALPQGQWYRAVLTRAGSNITFETFDIAGNPIGSVSTIDASGPSAYDRVVIRGGHNYYVDDISVTGTTVPSGLVLDRIGGLNATNGVGATTVAGLIAGDPDQATRIGTGQIDVPDSPTINLTTVTRRSLMAWINLDSTTGTQMIFEEGGTVNGFNVYVDGTDLRARAWANAWVTNSEVVAPGAVSTGTVHSVIATLDIAGGTRTMTLYLDGVQVDQSVIAEGSAMPNHTDNIGIGGVAENTQLHTGNTGATLALDGVIDEVVVYDTVVSAARAAALDAAGR